MRNIIFAIISVFLMAQCTPKTSSISQGDNSKPPPPVATENSSENNTSETTAGTTATEPTDFRATAPKPGPAPKIQLGTYESFELENGLKVIVVENNKVPRVSFQLTVDYDPILEEEAAGYLSIAGDMLSKGTSTRTKADIDEQIDFIGANMSTFSDGIFASSLTRHMPTLLELTSDVLLNPSFPQEEFDKIINQTLSGLKASKDDPNAISDNVADVMVYGKDHPYGEIVTEETVNKITLEKCKAFFDTYFKPNISYLVIVGDINVGKAKEMAKTYFGDWERGKVPTAKYDAPQAPDKTKVSFVDKTGAVQSVIKVTYPIDLQLGHPDYIPARLMNAILGGGGFSGRLMQNLREDKGYTYGARSSLIGDRLVGYFNAGASVRNEVTDSSVTQFLYEMDRLIDEKVDEKALQKTKNILTGSFGRSLERPQTIANFALNTAVYNLPADYYANYLTKLAAVTTDDIKKMAKKYIKPENAHIVVVGNKDDVAEKLARFSPVNKVHYYDIYGNPIEESTTEIGDDVTATSVIANYLDAIGGVDNLNKIKDMTTHVGLSTPQGEINLTIIQKAPNMLRQKTEGMGMLLQDIKYDGEKGYQTGMQGNGPVEGKALTSLAEQAIMFPELEYAKDSYEVELAGVEALYGKDAYKIQVTSPNGEKSTEFYDLETGYKVKVVTTAPGPGGPQPVVVEYDSFKEVDGVVLPHVMSVSGQVLKVKEYKLNTDVSDDEFKID
ncbi:MAG: insulinase family protein [Bacteroidota bacterium]